MKNKLSVFVCSLSLKFGKAKSFHGSYQQHSWTTFGKSAPDLLFTYQLLPEYFHHALQTWDVTEFLNRNQNKNFFYHFNCTFLVYLCLCTMPLEYLH